MSIQTARQLLNDYCKPANLIGLMIDLANEKGIQQSSLQALIASGEFVLDEKWIRRNQSFKPPITKKLNLDKWNLLDVVDAIQVFSNELGQSIKDAKWQSVQCPFHEDSKPSLRILLPDGGFNCLGCGERGGNVIDFIMILHSQTFPAAINYLAQNYTSIRQ